MEYIKLKDLCEKEERFVAPNDDAHIDYVDISSVDNKSKSLTKYDTYIFAEAPSRARKRVKHGDVIVSTVRPNLNAVARFNIQTPHTPIASTGFCVLRHKSDVDPIYIYFFCISPNFVRQMVAKATGASYPAVSDTIVREAKLPKHTAEKRFRIVSTLSKAKEIIEYRRAQLAKLDELVKCRFVEMFGTCTMVKTIKDCNFFISDGNYSSKYPRSEEFVSVGVPFIRANNIKNGTVIDDELYYITESKHAILRKGHLKVNDLLITTRGNTGQTAIVPFRHQDSNINAQIVLIRVMDGMMSPIYLREALNALEVQEQIKKLETGTALKQLPVGNLLKIKIRVPDISQQNAFAAFVLRIDKLRIIGKRGRQKA